MNMRYCSIDLETTGLDPETCDIVEVGAIIDDLSHPQPYDKLPRFHCYVIPYRFYQESRVYYQGEPLALAMHEKIFTRIAKREKGFDYYTPNDMTYHLASFLKNNNVFEKTVFVGKNIASFDLQFLKRIPVWSYAIDSSYRTLDPTPLFLKIGEDLVPPSMAKCIERANIKSDEALKHTAIADAMQVVKLMRHGLLSRESNIESDIEYNGPCAITGCTESTEAVGATYCIKHGKEFAAKRHQASMAMTGRIW